MKVAIIGATGLVGQTMCRVLAERKFPLDTLIPVASARSVGKTIKYAGQPCRVVDLEAALKQQPHIALFSAGSEVSRHWAPRFVEAGAIVIDNSSAWRMHPAIKLIVPEINANLLTAKDTLIANPNCSTIQMVMALAPLHQRFGLERVVVSTYQSVTGSGKAAVDQLNNEREGKEGPKAYPYPIDRNCLPHCDDFGDQGYTKEEWKLVHETRKILDAPGLGVTATAVRVPVEGGHAESVNARFARPLTLQEVRDTLGKTAGITVLDNPARNQYPMPRMVTGKDDVFVGRIRMDESEKQTVNLWIVADNLRKGAATNAVQIAEYLLKKS